MYFEQTKLVRRVSTSNIIELVQIARESLKHLNLPVIAFSFIYFSIIILIHTILELSKLMQ